MLTTIEAQRSLGRRKLSFWVIGGRVLLYLVLVGGALLMLSPFAYMLGISFSPNSYTLPSPADIFPAHPTLSNYISAWADDNFGQAFFNSVIVACGATVLTVLLSASLAFAFARYQFPGRNVLFYGMLATMTVPGIVLIIPQVCAGEPPGFDKQSPGPDPGLCRRHGIRSLYAAGLLRGNSSGTL